MKRNLLGIILLSATISAVSVGCGPETKKISAEEYQDKVYASWLGQMVGNIYGLVHENKYIDEPGPDDFPYGYDYAETWFGGRMTDVMRQYDGAFSDDDTDFEYMYLILTEKYGPEPTYEQIAEAWKYHVRDFVWIANRSALTLMHVGFTPPATGQRVHNEHWFQIDPQLINEFWAVTSPGMVRYAVEKSDWGARITNDDWGVEPTVFYGAMYAAAFFESDVNTLIEIAIEAMPEGSRFVETVQEMKRLYAQYPDDYRAARDEMAQKYYHQEEESVKTIWNANLNGASGILALLYGQGDFQRTLDLSNYFGFDADNQAATMAGLLGVANGTAGIPHELLHPIEGWTEPFNDRYVNRTRFDLPDAGIKDMAARTVAQAENIILMHGGRKVEEDGQTFYVINPEAEFVPPLELHPQPPLSIEAGTPLTYTFYAGGSTPVWTVTEGSVPPGLSFANGVLEGTPSQPGRYSFTVEVSDGVKDLQQTYEVLVAGDNLARTASDILVHENNTEKEPEALERLRDGRGMDGEAYVSFSTDNQPKEDLYGYQWESPQEIGLIRYQSGRMQERGGWFTSLRAEYLSEDLAWLPVDNLNIAPDVLEADSRYVQPSYVAYTLTFDPVLTRAVRVIGAAGGQPGRADSDRPIYFTSVSELGVYPALPE